MRHVISRRATLLGCGAIALAGLASVTSAATIWGVDNLGNANAGTVGDRIVKFNSSNPVGTIVTVGDTGISTTMVGLDFNAAGTLFACSNTQLYTINKTTGAATAVGSGFASGNFSMNDLTFDAANNRMIGIAYNSSTGVNRAYLINTTTGVASSLGAISGLATGAIIVGAATDASGKIYLEDITNDQMYAQSSGLAFTAMSSTIGKDIIYSQGMTIDAGGDNTWYAATLGPSSPPYTSDVRTMSLTTGGTTAVLGTFPTDSASNLPEYELGDIAVVPAVPEPTAVALVAVSIAALTTRRRRQRSTVGAD